MEEEGGGGEGDEGDAPIFLPCLGFAFEIVQRTEGCAFETKCGA